MKRIAIAGGVLVALIAVAFAVVWLLPSVQDSLVKRAIIARASSGDHTSLLKDDALHILLCGTGSPMPDPTRAGACTAVLAGGHIVVIDAGPGSWARLAEARVPAGAIDTVLLTHLHSDHVGGLGEIAVQSWVAGRKVPLDVYGPAVPDDIKPPLDAEGHAYGVSGTAAVVAGFAAAGNTDAAFRLLHHGVDYLAPEGARMIAHEIVKPAPDGSVTVFDRDGLKIAAFLVNHHPVEPAFGYRIEYRGRVAVVSGDTEKVANMVRFSKEADLLLHEALNAQMVGMLIDALDRVGDKRRAKLARDTIDYHTSPIDAAGIANEARVRLLVFTHVVPPLPNALMRHMFLRGVAEARGEGDTLLGYDGLMISLPSGSKEIETTDLR